jgi:alcohol dehydrogenase
MRQLTLEAPGALAWHDVPEPDLEDDGQALVRPLAVATCDLDGPMVAGATPFPAPIAMGHECVAEVVAVGRGVRAAAVGDRVVVPFQISCGTCERCRRGQTGDCARMPPLSSFGFGAAGGSFGGFLSDLVRVPFADAMLVRVPDGLDPRAVASASDNLPDALRLVAPHLAERPGADVLVVGGGTRSIALYAVDLARALGAGRVAYVDDDPARLAVASDLGADVTEAGAEGDFAITADCSSTEAGMKRALRATEPGGHCTHAGGNWGRASLNMLVMYTKGLHLHVGRASARPGVPPVLALAAAGRIRPERVTDRVLAWDEAPAALVAPHTKLVFARD